MKLIKLHIENFGKFTSFDFSFKEGLNVLCEENGYGKTTIAAFIKAMFYGMPKHDGRTVGFTDRKHYLPFNGGKYGGSLTFETGGAEYRIERTFDPRSDTRDTLTVYRNNAIYSGLGRDIGMKVFGIDRDSFERTAFVDSDEIEMRASDSISAKLNSIAGGVKSGETITAATDKLTAAAKQYKLERGSGGKIYDISQKINGISRDIFETEGIARGLTQKYADYSKLQVEISGLEIKSSTARDAAVVNARWKTYDNLAAQEQAARQEYEAIVGAYPQGIPAKEEIAELKNCSARIERNKNAMDIKAFGGGQKQRLEELEVRFASGVPTESVLGEADKKAMRCYELERDIEGLKGMPADPRLENLGRKFAGGTPQDSMIADCEQKLNALRDTDARITARMTAGQPQQPRPQGKKGGKWHIVLGLIAVLLIIGGIALMFINVIAGGALAGAGAVLLVVALIAYLKNKNVKANAPAVNVDGTLADLQYSKNKYTEELRAVLAPYGYYSASVEGDFAALKNDLQTFTELKVKAENTAKEIAVKTAELETIRADLSKLLAEYGESNANLQAGLRSLRALAEEYARLCNEQRRAADYVRAAGDDIGASYGTAKAILAKYGIALSGSLDGIIGSVEQAARDAARLTAEIDARHGEAENYRAENGLTERPVQTEDGGIDGLNDMLAEKNRQLAALESEITVMEARTEKLDGLKGSLAAAKEELAAAEERHKLLVAAREMLKTAQQNLKDKYVAPVKDKFTFYAGKIETALGDKVSMDGDFSVSFERGGAITSEKYLSAGQRCVCALCFRLALMDNMYSGERPFIVMDDPFVNLDEAHLKDAVKLVKALAEDRQIIYFCCHGSRIA